MTPSHSCLIVNYFFGLRLISQLIVTINPTFAHPRQNIRAEFNKQIKDCTMQNPYLKEFGHQSKIHNTIRFNFSKSTKNKQEKKPNGLKPHTTY